KTRSTRQWRCCPRSRRRSPRRWKRCARAQRGSRGMGDSIPRDVDMAYVEIGVRGAVDHRLESKAALAVLAIIAANPAVKVAVTVGGWDDDDRAVWEIPEARDCV